MNYSGYSPISQVYSHTTGALRAGDDLQPPL